MSLELWQDGDHTGHLVFQVFVPSQLDRDIPIYKADPVAAVKLDVVRYGFILLKNGSKSHSGIQDRVSLDRKLFILDHMIHLDPIEIGDAFIPFPGAFDKNTAAVKINVAVQIGNTAHRLFFPHGDHYGIPV